MINKNKFYLWNTKNRTKNSQYKKDIQKKHGSKFGGLRFGKDGSNEKKGHEIPYRRCADNCYYEDPKHA